MHGHGVDDECAQPFYSGALLPATLRKIPRP
jgi:hypothetical protein